MPTTLGQPYAPAFRGIPTHMSTEDHLIWLLYQPRLIRTATTLYFDVKLGGEQALLDATGSEFSPMWYALNAKRADVLAVEPPGVTIIELRDNAQANAVGRLLLYDMLWKRDPALPGPVKLRLVTNRLDPDVRDQAAAHAIEYNVV